MDNSTLLMWFKDWIRNDTFYSPEAFNSLHRTTRYNALKLFRDCAQRVPAYKDFLRKHHIHFDKIKTHSDFIQIPATSKKNYIEEYDIVSRCWDGDVSRMHMISTSSGTTGLPHFWPRNLQHEIEGAYLHEFIFKEAFNIHKNKTLFIDGFAMGNWIAGTFTLACVSLVAWKGYPLTIMTPGYSTEAVIELLERISQRFQQTILSGHTPFLKEVVDVGSARGINWQKLRIKFLGTGQGITESWRQYILKLVKEQDYFHTFINLYGSADASLMGFETPLSILIRKIIVEKKMHLTLFGDSRIPSLYNYDPRLIFFEEVGKELHITKNSGCPLIRYNIQDEGGVVEYPQIKTKLGDELLQHKLVAAVPRQGYLPFVYLYGRSKFMVKIYGANIYTEHVQMVVDHELLQPRLTGRFLLESEYDENNNPCLVCRFELNPGIATSKDFKKLIEKTFISVVSQVNNEYKDVMSRMGNKVRPKIIIHEHADPRYFPKDKVKKTA